MANARNTYGALTITLTLEVPGDTNVAVLTGMIREFVWQVAGQEWPVNLAGVEVDRGVAVRAVEVDAPEPQTAEAATIQGERLMAFWDELRVLWAAYSGPKGRQPKTLRATASAYAALLGVPLTDVYAALADNQVAPLVRPIHAGASQAERATS